MDVRGAPRVVAREDGFELGDAVGVSQLDAAQEGRVKVGRVGAVAVAVGDDAPVDAGGVAVPNLDVEVGDRVARRDVDDLVVEEEGDAGLGLDDVLADVLAGDV